MAAHREVEIKFAVPRPAALARRLRAAGFKRVSSRKLEVNTLYDLPGGQLRRRGEILRLRTYGREWMLTHKSKGTTGRHKTRVETECGVSDGLRLEAILRALGYLPVVRYEKLRTIWSDEKGLVAVDETPVGVYGEIEGGPAWIDKTARALGVSRGQYITATYLGLFAAWKQRNRSRAKNMTFREVGRRVS
jgi:adenylate cyclase class 2